MKAVICPVCGGTGRVDNPDKYGNTYENATKPCHGCGGCGWVSVPD